MHTNYFCSNSSNEKIPEKERSNYIFICLWLLYLVTPDSFIFTENGIILFLILLFPWVVEYSFDAFRDNSENQHQKSNSRKKNIHYDSFRNHYPLSENNTSLPNTALVLIVYIRIWSVITDINPHNVSADFINGKVQGYWWDSDQQKEKKWPNISVNKS